MSECGDEKLRKSVSTGLARPEFLVEIEAIAIAPEGDERGK